MVPGASDLIFFCEGVESRMNEAQSLVFPNLLFGVMLLAFGSQFFSSANGH